MLSMDSDYNSDIDLDNWEIINKTPTGLTPTGFNASSRSNTPNKNLISIESVKKDKDENLLEFKSNIIIQLNDKLLEEL